MVAAVNKIFSRLALATSLLIPSAAFAHRLDEYLQATLVSIEQGRIRFEINLTPGVAVAEQLLALIDRDRNGAISTNEAAAYAELLKRDLTVRLDGRELELHLDASNFPDPAEIRTGWGIIQMEFSAPVDHLASGTHKITFENRHLPKASVYLFNAARPASDTIEIGKQHRNQNQSTGEIEFAFHAPPTSLSPVGIALATALVGFVGVAIARAQRNSKRDASELIARHS